MLRFYGRLAIRGIRAFWQATDWWSNVLWVVTYLVVGLAIVNKPVGKFLLETWTGFPYWYGLAALGVLFLYGFLKEVHAEFISLNAQVSESDKRIQVLEDRLSPKLELFFDPERFPSCRMEQVQPLTGLTVRRFRVGVRSSSTVDEVKVSLENFEPQGAHFLPIPLVRMHDSSDNFQSSQQGVTLNPGEVMYVDVAVKRVTNDPGDEIFWCYAVGVAGQSVPPRRYTVTLQATGRSVQACQARFVVDVDSAGALTFNPATNTP